MERLYTHIGARILPVQGDVYKHSHHTIQQIHQSLVPSLLCAFGLCPILCPTMWSTLTLLSGDQDDTAAVSDWSKLVPEGQLWTCTTIDDQDYRIQVWGSEVIKLLYPTYPITELKYSFEQLNKQHTRLNLNTQPRCEFQWGFFMENDYPSSISIISTFYNHKVSWKDSLQNPPKNWRT